MSGAAPTYTIEQLHAIVRDNPGSPSDSNSLPWYEQAGNGKYRLLNPHDYPINRYQKTASGAPTIPKIPIIPPLPRSRLPDDSGLVGPVYIPPTLSRAPQSPTLNISSAGIYVPPAPSHPPAQARPSTSNFYYV